VFGVEVVGIEIEELASGCSVFIPCGMNIVVDGT
jgi:hypothetical protein